MPETPATTAVTSEKHAKMMTEGCACAVLVTSDTGKTSPGQVRFREWDKKERTKRALKFWLYAWAAAILSIAIPVMHFFLVPTLLLVGPAGAWVVSTQGSAILGGESVCPDCGAFLPLSPASDDWPLKDLCAQCQNRMKIEKA
jgi:hypothetical protein